MGAELLVDDVPLFASTQFGQLFEQLDQGRQPAQVDARAEVDRRADAFRIGPVVDAPVLQVDGIDPRDRGVGMAHAGRAVEVQADLRLEGVRHPQVVGRTLLGTLAVPDPVGPLVLVQALGRVGPGWLMLPCVPRLM
jgi:hypothetical protein